VIYCRTSFYVFEEFVASFPPALQHFSSAISYSKLGSTVSEYYATAFPSCWTLQDRSDGWTVETVKRRPTLIPFYHTTPFMIRLTRFINFGHLWSIMKINSHSDLCRVRHNLVLYIFRAAMLHVQKFNTNFLHRVFYLLINSPSYFGLRCWPSSWSS
jgi:hypothetical protein